MRKKNLNPKGTTSKKVKFDFQRKRTKLEEIA